MTPGEAQLLMRHCSESLKPPTIFLPMLLITSHSGQWLAPTDLLLSDALANDIVTAMIHVPVIDTSSVIS